MAENLNITNRRIDEVAGAPTPQNTPSYNQAPITGAAQEPRVAPIPEGQEHDDAHEALTSGLANMIQGRLDSLAGKSSGYIESLPQNVQDRIKGLKGIQSRHLELEAELQREIFKLEKAFLEKLKPFYEKRSRIIAGKDEPSKDEIEEGERIAQAQAAEQESEELEKISSITSAMAGETPATGSDVDKTVAGIPGFWLTAMKNMVNLADIISSRDEEALNHLIDIRYSYFEKPGFCLEFEFGDNDFFTNKVIKKRYIYKDELGKTGEYVYDYAEGDKIEWKDDKNLTVSVETKKQRNKNTRQTRYVKRTVPCESFFNFFDPPVVSEDMDVSSELQYQLESDYQLGEEIKEKLIPRAADWFTGEADLLEDELLDDGDLDEEDFDNYSDGNESDNDGEDDDSDEEAAEGKPKNDNAECRQQ